MTEDMYKKLAQAVIDGEEEDVVNLAKQALDQNLDPLDCIANGLTKGIQEVGELFASGEYYLPEMIISAEVMKAAMEILEPALAGDQQPEVVARVVVGTVKGDLHEIGKTLVGTMLSAHGFKVIDLGVDISIDEFVSAIQENDATIVGASALLTTTMGQQEKLIEKIKESGLEKQVKVMVGGAPVTKSYAEQIGADGFAEDAISAVDMAFRLADGSA